MRDNLTREKLRSCVLEGIRAFGGMDADRATSDLLYVLTFNRFVPLWAVESALFYAVLLSETRRLPRGVSLGELIEDCTPAKLVYDRKWGEFKDVE